MRISRLSAILAPAVLLLAMQFAWPTPAQADTYQLFKIGADNEFSFDGMNSAGLAVFADTSASPAYHSFLNGVSQGSTGIAPPFTPDNGTPCTPSLPSGWFVEYGVCNNGHVAWTGSGINPPTDVYFNLNPTQPSSGPQFGGSVLYLNSIGDAVIDDGFGDNWYYALDLTDTPAVTTAAATTSEPSTLLLLATGILAPIVFLRRRSAPVAHL